MTKKRERRTDFRALCGSSHADDGIDPRTWKDLTDPNDPAAAGGPDQAGSLRKQRALAREAERRLHEVFASRVIDARVLELEIVRVEPQPGGRLRVLFAPRPGARIDVDDVLQRLERLRPFLRQELATAVRRRRAPDLLFAIAPPEELP